MKTFNVVLGTFVWILCAGPMHGEFTALNDHYAGPATHSNATTWNVFGKTQGAPGNAGRLKDLATGRPLPVKLWISFEGAKMGAASQSPWTTSAAGFIFRGCDFGNPVPYPMINLPGAEASVTHQLSGLDPKKKYRLFLTATRGGGYADRWTLMELIGAVSFKPAHTPASLTNGLAPTEVAINTGDNRVEGATAVWTDIVPEDSGTISVVSRQYTGALPEGYPARPGPYAHGPVALRLDELGVTTTPPKIALEPSDTTTFVGKMFCATVGLEGGEPSDVQWFKNGKLMLQQKHTSLWIRSVSTGDSGNYSAVASNRFGSVKSRTLRLNVIGPDTPALALIGLTNTWKYAGAGEELKSNWMKADFDDSGWKTGQGFFGYSESGFYAEYLQTALPKVDAQGNPIATRYYRAHFSSSVGGSNVFLYSTNVFTEGIICYLNGQEVLRSFMKDGPVESSTLAADPMATVAPLINRFSLRSDALRVGDNVMAVEVHPAVPNSRTVLFGLWLNAYIP